MEEPEIVIAMLFGGPFDGGNNYPTKINSYLIFPIDPKIASDGSFETHKFAKYKPIDIFGRAKVSRDGKSFSCKCQKYEFVDFVASDDLVAVEG